jgi:hypothetical protein
MKKIGLISSVFLVSFISCNKPVEAEVPKAQLVPVADGLPVNHAPINVPLVPLEGLVGRKPKRLSIDQLNASIEAATGMKWTETVNGIRNTDVLDYLAPTLGRPDYAYITQDNLEPNVMFAKFMGDGARKVCSDVAAKDKSTTAEKKVLVKNIQALDATNTQAIVDNVVYLRTRFFSDASTQYAVSAPFVKVFHDTIAAQGSAEDGWLAVCVAMLTDPQFLTY